MKLHYISQVFFEIRPTDQLVSESSSRLASQPAGTFTHQLVCWPYFKKHLGNIMKFHFTHITFCVCEAEILL